MEAATLQAVPNPPQPKLITKLLQAIAKLENIPKSGWNPHSGYHYIQVDVIAASVRKALAEVGLVLLGDVVERKTDTAQTSGGKTAWCEDVMIRYTLTDGESQFLFTVPGSGQDTSDKALPKAITSSRKGALLILLNLGGEDPETASLETGPAKGARPSSTAAPQRSQPPLAVVKPSLTPQSATTPPDSGASAEPSVPMATPRQVNACYALAKACQIDADRLKKGLQDGWKVDRVEDLTRKQASELLDILKTEQKRYPPVPSQIHEG